MLIKKDELGQIKVDNTILPGIFESLEISDDITLDEAEIEGKEKKGTQATGYDPARVTLTIQVDTDYNGGKSCYDKLKTIQKIFKRSGQNVPEVHRIVDRHLQARGISQVLFSNLRSTENNQKDILSVSCEFIEYVAIKAKIKKKTGQSAQQAAGKSEPNKKDNTPAIDNEQPNKAVIEGIRKAIEGM